MATTLPAQAIRSTGQCPGESPGILALTRWAKRLTLGSFCLLSVTSSAADTLITAHRGNSSEAPENTIASIYAAVGFADLSEMDVRATSDGELVLMHNATINKTTDGKGVVRRKTLDDLQSLDAGTWFSHDFAGEPVPTLEDAVNVALDFGIEPLIERKAGSALLFHNVFQEMALDPSEFRVISFNRKFIRDLDALNPAYRLGVLGAGRLSNARLERLADDGADFLSWHHGSVRNTSTIELVHNRGMELHVWTVNETRRMEQLIDLGVDAITTDFPERLYGLLEPESNFAAISSSAMMVAEPAGASPIYFAAAMLLLSIRRRR